ncbi:MAG: hypothetical protein IPP17_14875 [Bacteroidetes bacterium]|nr:hypothetical protein [Bacteroidota bacterium]
MDAGIAQPCRTDDGCFDLEFESEDPEFLAYIERMVDFLHFLAESEPLAAGLQLQADLVCDLQARPDVCRMVQIQGADEFGGLAGTAPRKIPKNSFKFSSRTRCIFHSAAGLKTRWMTSQVA